MQLYFLLVEGASSFSHNRQQPLTTMTSCTSIIESHTSLQALYSKEYKQGDGRHLH